MSKRVKKTNKKNKEDRAYNRIDRKLRKLSPKKNVIGLLIAIAILFGSSIAGMLTGVFEGLSAISEGILLKPETILKIIIVIGFMYAFKCIANIIFSFFKLSRARSKTIATIILSLIKYAIILIGVCWILTIIGVNVSTIFASVGVVALIVGFGAESLVSDLVTGVFVLIENQFNVGDIIEVDGFRGTVENISVRTISVRDAGGNVKIINNSDLNNVINRSDRGSVAVTEVGVSYETDLEKFDEQIVPILADIKERHQDIFIGEINYLGVEELADSCVKLKFVAEVVEADVFSGKRMLNKELKIAFDKAHIEIAYPQLDIHTK